MNESNQHEKLNYLEVPVRDPEATRAFFESVFGWSFTMYGPDYMDSASGGIMVGFFRDPHPALTENGSVLVTFFSDDLEATQAKIEAAGGKVIKPAFDFPGGRRFQFTEPGGSEFSVWSDKPKR